MPRILCGCDTWSHSLIKKKMECAGKQNGEEDGWVWWKGCFEGITICDLSPCFVTEIKQGRIRWVGHAASLRKFRRAYNFFQTCLEEPSREI